MWSAFTDNAGDRLRRKHKVDCKVYREQFSYDKDSDTIYYKYVPNGQVALQPRRNSTLTTTRSLPQSISKFSNYYTNANNNVSPPKSVDHRARQSSMDNQGSVRGTCTAFATAAAIEALNNKRKLSKNFLYLAIENYNMNNFCLSDGDFANVVSAVLSSTALPADSYWPYTPQTTVNSCPAGPPAGRANHQAFRVKTLINMGQNRDLTRPGADANNPKFLEAVLAAGHDIIIFSDVAWFPNKIHDGEKRYGLPIDVMVDSSGTPLAPNGGHAMLIVGYERTDDAQIGGGYFWLKNSWGTDIGQGGYVRITYDYARQYFQDGIAITAIMTPQELQAAGGALAGGGTPETNGSGFASTGQNQSRGTKCADENGQCKFSGRARVHYGANDKWVVREFNNGVACSNRVFGDPIVGVRKACYFEPITAAPTTKIVSLKSHHGRYVVAEANGAANANRTAVGPWEKWQLITNSDGTVSFKGHHGKYLVAEGDGAANANRGAIGPWEKWQLIRHRDGTVSLKSHHGKYLVAEGDGKLNANRTAVGPWERFTLVNH